MLMYAGVSTPMICMDVAHKESNTHIITQGVAIVQTIVAGLVDVKMNNMRLIIICVKRISINYRSVISLMAMAIVIDALIS